MPLTVTMPQLGESVTEGTIGRWLKQPGEPVAKYESIAEVISDKVNAEIPAPADGVMGEHIAAEGAVVAVGQPICSIETGAVSAAPEPTAAPATSASGGNGSAEPVGQVQRSGREQEGAPAPVAAPPPVAAPVQPAVEPAAGASAPPAVSTPSPGAPGPNANPGDNVHMTPAVRMLVREHGVDPTDVPGTGIAGRITKKDVLEYVQHRDAGAGQQPASVPDAPPAPLSASPQRAAPPSPASAQPPLQSGGEHDTLVPIHPIRRLIAEHMVRSKHTSPHAWMMVEVDMTGVVALRSRLKAEYKQRHGVDLTFLPIIARVVCETLRRYPNFNATWTEEGIIQRGDINLGIAVALEDNLVVPVIRQADSLTVAGLAQAFNAVAQRARSNRLRVDDLQGGTFTLNNTGSLGLVATAAIINQPQAAIMTTDAIVKRPVVVQNDAIAIRSMMNLCLSIDHRLNDGLQAARFLTTTKAALEALTSQSSLL